jgi:small subunit ribosomal protein S21
LTWKPKCGYLFGSAEQSRLKPVQKGAITVEVKVFGDNVEKALRIFRDVKRRAHFEKPSEKRKRKQREAKRTRMKALRSRR